ncbi:MULTISPECIES: ATP-binding protein [unclassified Aliivibrio]|uniref:ATP-binding protein n=1 Tax=unclassified Aliivibrio TaxID=2645654 RepID=UPI00080DDCE9|nr:MULTISPECIES: ATP-binding protein [unclassified Aliivibrio]OCH18969.1 histidine kinase [Aliivibrio sp. 1S165]OCH19846.1 histidine kinase [Aliivibrio sp. 1S128]OCH30836.1 histidine kinase [Aliivibrio sp. 1S175]
MKKAPRHLKDTFKKLSLKSRLLLAAAFWLSAMILAAGVGIPKLVSDYLVQDTKDQLSLSMDEITANIEVDSEGKLIMPSRLSDPRFNQPYSGIYWTIKTKGNELRSRSLWDKKLTFEEDSLSINTKVKGANNEELIYVQKNIYLPEIKQPITITIGLDEDPLEKTLHQLTGQLWVILGLLFSGVLFLIGIQVSWSLRPLAKMQSELVMLRKGEQQALSQHYPQEIAPLVSDLNALLFHYQELLERARHHAGNLSHSLKTPLSVLKNELSYLTEEEKARLSIPIDQLQEHIDYHLGRARMAGAMNILSVATSPSERIDAISMAFDKVYAEREILLINELDTDSKITVDKTDLDEMLGNLLENSYKWAHSMIRVHASIPVNNQISIIIEDDGCGIPIEKFEHVLKRGFRLDESTPGTGLGLHIVNEMAHSYRGSLALDKSPMGGLKATLTFPLVQN